MTTIFKNLFKQKNKYSSTILILIVVISFISFAYIKRQNNQTTTTVEKISSVSNFGFNPDYTNSQFERFLISEPFKLSFYYPSDYKFTLFDNNIQIIDPECRNSPSLKEVVGVYGCNEVNIVWKVLAENTSRPSKAEFLQPYSVNQCNEVKTDQFKQDNLFGREVLTGTIVDDCPNSPYTLTGLVDYVTSSSGKSYAIIVAYLGGDFLSETLLKTLAYQSK